MIISNNRVIWQKKMMFAGKSGGRSVWGGFLQEGGGAEGLGQQESGEYSLDPYSPLLMLMLILMLMLMLIYCSPSIHFIWANVTESIADICICICILFVLVFDALTKNANLCHQLAFKLHNWLAKTTNWWSFIARDICSDAIVVATLTRDCPPLTLSDLSLYTLPATVVGRSNVIVLIFMLFSPCKSNLNLTNYMAMGLHFLRKINEWDGLNCAEYLLSQSILLHLLSFAIGQFGKFEILISIPNSSWNATLFCILHS